MIKKVFKRGVFLLAALLALPAGAAASRVQEIRLTGQGESARLVIGLSAPVRHSLFTLSGPDRVVVDLKDARLAAGVRLPAGAGPVKAVRSGPQPGGTLRLVVDLRARVPARIAPEAAGRQGQRLVIELGTAGAEASAAAAVAAASSTPAAGPGPAADRVVPERVVKAAPEPAGDRTVVVAIDAGHGGQDPGAIGPSGTHEKDVVLAIARELARRIEAEPGMRAVLTRQDDRFLSLRERIGRARAAKADLFVSIHADSIAKPDVSGSSVYILSENGASSEQARWLAERENAADLMGGVSLADKDRALKTLLLDLSQSASIAASMSAAQRVLNALDDVGEIRKREVQQAGFVVLKSPDIPSMLIETAYISNREDERRLKSDAYQAKLASAILSGVKRYFEDNPPEGSRFARQRRGSGAGVGVVAAPSLPR